LRFDFLADKEVDKKPTSDSIDALIDALAPHQVFFSSLLALLSVFANLYGNDNFDNKKNRDEIYCQNM
jgi:hypothetical protein